MKKRTLCFTQEINEEVLEYVRNTPTCQNGVRDGDIIYVTKIPYMARQKPLGKSSVKLKVDNSTEGPLGGDLVDLCFTATSTLVTKRSTHIVKRLCSARVNLK